MRRYVERGDAISNNEPLFRVTELTRLVVRLGIPERDVGALEEGQQTGMNIDAIPDQTFLGTIQRIHPSADENSPFQRQSCACITAEGDEPQRLGGYDAGQN